MLSLILASSMSTKNKRQKRVPDIPGSMETIEAVQTLQSVESHTIQQGTFTTNTWPVKPRDTLTYLFSKIVLYELSVIKFNKDL